MAVGALVLHAANPPGDARDLDDCAAGLTAGDLGQDDLHAVQRCAFAGPCKAPGAAAGGTG